MSKEDMERRYVILGFLEWLETQGIEISESTREGVYMLQPKEFHVLITYFLAKKDLKEDWTDEATD